jgi:hypothetical protein
MGKGYYIKKDNKDGLSLNIKKDQFIQYLQGITGDWIRFKIYERDTLASNGLAFNMELIERKSEQVVKNVELTKDANSSTPGINVETSN